MRYLTFIILIIFISCTNAEEKFYTIAETPWEESLGNHRAVLQVDNQAEAVAVDILWRRHDNQPDHKKFIIVHESGNEVKNIQRVEVNNERCQLVFGPAEESGIYYFYYLPYEVQKNYGFYNKGYLKPEKNWSKNFTRFRDT